jgi:hypothetical protein
MFDTDSYYFAWMCSFLYAVLIQYYCGCDCSNFPKSWLNIKFALFDIIAAKESGKTVKMF